MIPGIAKEIQRPCLTFYQHVCDIIVSAYAASRCGSFSQPIREPEVQLQRTQVYHE
jgi:hypothetical protein